LTAADVQVRDDENILVISMTAIKDKIASFTTKLEIPLSKIESVSTEPAQINYKRTLRTLGTSVPPSHLAGRFYEIGKGKEFFLLGNKNRCITLSLKNFKFKRVIVEVRNKLEVAEMIRNRLS
jgi:hypothetical protein